MCFLGLFFVDSPRKTIEKFMSTYMNGQHTAVPPYTPVFLSYPELLTFLNISTVNCSVYKRFLLLTSLTTNCLSYLYFFKVDLFGTVCIPYYSYCVLFVFHNIPQMYYWYSLLIEHLCFFSSYWILFGIRSVLMFVLRNVPIDNFLVY